MGQVACLLSCQCSASEQEKIQQTLPTIKKERLSEQFSKIPSAPEGTNAQLPLSTS